MESLDQLELSLESVAEADEKVNLLLDFMQKMISQKERARLKEFWSAKNLCVQAFKGPIPHIKRKVLWERFTELTQEAKLLRSHLEEVTAFAVEQIHIAVDALEREIDKLSITPITSLPRLKHRDLLDLQKLGELLGELHALNASGKKLEALRKELLKTDMRIGEKSRMLKHLSHLGDKVFPKKKILQKELGKLLIQAAERLEEKKSKEGSEAIPSLLRSDVKALQASLKQMILSSNIYNKVRKKLSQIWDEISAYEEEWKVKRKDLQEREKNQLEKLLQEIEGVKTSSQFESTKVQVEKKLIELRLSKESEKTVKDKFAQVAYQLRLQRHDGKSQAEEKHRKAWDDHCQTLQNYRNDHKKVNLEDACNLENHMSEYFDAKWLSTCECMQLKKEIHELKHLLLYQESKRAKTKDAKEELLGIKREHIAKLREFVECCKRTIAKTSLDFKEAIELDEFCKESKKMLDELEGEGE